MVAFSPRPPSSGALAQMRDCATLSDGSLTVFGVHGFGVQTNMPILYPLTVTPRILRAMSERQSEFTNFRPVRVAVGTWNVNGGKQFRSNLLGTAELADWLLDAPALSGVTGPQGETTGAAPLARSSPTRR